VCHMQHQCFNIHICLSANRDHTKHYFAQPMSRHPRNREVSLRHTCWLLPYAMQLPKHRVPAQQFEGVSLTRLVPPYVLEPRVDVVPYVAPPAKPHTNRCQVNKNWQYLRTTQSYMELSDNEIQKQDEVASQIANRSGRHA